MRSNADTIVACGSAAGDAARGLVRVSGALVHDLVAKWLGDVAPRMMHAIRLPMSCDVPDVPALAWYADGPRTYTGEPTLELQCVGHRAVLQRVVDRCIQHGCRVAEPGEFTFRAWTHHRLDLTQAEGIAATISATSDAQLDAARRLKTGQLGNAATQLVDAVATPLALIEAGIDFTDQDDVVPIPPKELHARLVDLQQQLTDTLHNAQPWATLEALPRVVLAGPPSAGKSALFNALLGHERSVVDATPGTTRDVIEEPLKLDTPTGPLQCMLVDLAGLDTPVAQLDELAQRAARRAIDDADLVVWLTPSTRDLSDRGYEKHNNTLNVISKSDLLCRAAQPNALHVSARTGAGLETLRQAIAQALPQRGASLREHTLVLQPRHETALRDALQSITAAREHLAPHVNAHALPDIELLAGHLRHALDALASLGGTMTPDDIIGRVFATFCVGK